MTWNHYSITKPIIFFFDLIICSIVGLIFISFIICLALKNRIQKTSSDSPKEKKILFIAVATYDALLAKGILHMVFERDEFGFFDHVYSIHLLAHKEQTILLNERNTLIEFGGRYPRTREYGFYCLSILFNNIYSFNFLSKLIKSEKITIIRATDPSFHGFYGSILGWVTKTPWCISIHADYDKRHLLGKGLSPVIFGSRGLAKILERVVLSQAPVVMPIRESLGEWAVANGAKKERIRIIPHGVDTDHFIQNHNSNIQEKYGLQGKKLIVFAGRLSKDNYVDDILDAAMIVSQKKPDAVFLLIGDGPEKEELLQKISKSHLADNVKLPGFLPNDKVKEFRMLADVNICLMGGFSLIESALSGKPTLAYDVEWHYELIKNGETGYLIKEHDINGIADAIRELLSNPQLSELLGRNARQLAIERHSLKNTSKIKIACYNELLQMSNR